MSVKSLRNVGLLNRPYNQKGLSFGERVYQIIRLLVHLTMFRSSLPPVVCRRVHVLFMLFVFVCYGGIHHILCFVFVLLFFHLLPVSLNCPFFIAPSVFSNVYLRLFYTEVVLLCNNNCLIFQCKDVYRVYGSLTWIKKNNNLKYMK